MPQLVDNHITSRYCAFPEQNDRTKAPRPRPQNFFHVFYEKMTDAQAEIKSTVTVNTSDIAARASDADKDPAKAGGPR